MNNNAQNTPWLLWPFKALMDLIEGIIKLTGRLVAAVIGLADHDRRRCADRPGHHRPAGHPDDHLRFSADGARDFLNHFL